MRFSPAVSKNTVQDTKSDCSIIIKRRSTMTTFVLFLCSMSAACLQLLSRNLFYILVAAMGIITVLVMEYCKEKELHWGWQVPSLLGNCFMLGNAISMHSEFGHIINDYLIISVMLTLFIVLTIVEMLPHTRKTPSA